MVVNTQRVEFEMFLYRHVGVACENSTFQINVLALVNQISGREGLWILNPERPEVLMT